MIPQKEEFVKGFLKKILKFCKKERREGTNSSSRKGDRVKNDLTLNKFTVARKTQAFCQS
jgi:hypothetical protein